MASIYHGLVSVGSRLQKVGGRRWSEDRLLRLLCRVSISVYLTVRAVEVVFIVTDFFVIFLILVVFLVFALRAFVISVELSGKTLAPTLSLHASAKRFEVMALLAPLFEFFVVSRAFLGHFKDVSVRLVVLASEGEIFLF